MKSFARIVQALIAVFALSAFAQSGTTDLTVGVLGDDPLANLKPGHPRLLVSATGWQALLQRQKTDSELAKLVEKIQSDAKVLLRKPPLIYKKDGKRLLDVSRQAIQRIVLWSMTYHLTGDTNCSVRAKEELLHLAEFSDWNPSHFLDVAEMTAAFALGYDWLYDELDEAARATIRRAIVEKGLRPGLVSSSWQRSENNWNQVCFGGLTLGALAIGNEEPEVARGLLRAARKGIVNGLRVYAPDGIYPEGPSYWEYGTTYQVLMIEALQSALGTRWQLDASPGFMSSAGVVLQMTGPTGAFYNYSDGDERQALFPALFWFAREQQDLSLLRYQHKPLTALLARPVEREPKYRENRYYPMIALWWCGLPDQNAAPRLSAVWRGNGRNPVGVFRASWTDTNALYLAFKGGAANLSHGHMDAGSFILEADGVRWALDLGKQDYLSLESKGVKLWDGAQNGGRWSVFRLNNHSHNTLTIGDQLHRVAGNARIVEFTDSANPSATLDLTPVFAGQATNVTRRFAFGAERTVSIQDRLAGLTPGTEVRWAMVTKAEVKVDGNQAVLKQDGKTLRATLLAPAGVKFLVIPADPPNDDFNAPNPKTWMLTATMNAPASGEMDLEVELQPGSAKAE